jgi:hypothetical protein
MSYGNNRRLRVTIVIKKNRVDNTFDPVFHVSYCNLKSLLE